MGNDFWKGTVSWFAGSTIAFIITSIVFRIGWENKEHLLILGYGGITSVLVFFITKTNSFKERELRDIDDKIKMKADQKDIDNIKDTLEGINDRLEKYTQKIDKIYEFLIRQNHN